MNSQSRAVLNEADRAATKSMRPAGGPPAPRPSPSVGLSLRFILTGLGCLLAGIGLLVVQPAILATYHYNQFVISLTHLFTLGWVCSIIMGALYQLVPVALETTLYSERVARWQFGLHLIGVIGMVSMFWVWNMKQVGHFGSLFALGVILFVYNISRTLARIPRWNLIAAAIASALFWLLLTILLGLFLAASKVWPLNFFAPIAQMHAHAHMGILGFFLTMTVGISYKLVPMFTLSEIQCARRAGASIALLNVGLAGALPCILLESRWKFVFALVIALGLFVYGLEMMAVVRARQRRALDWGVRYFLTALSFFLPVSGLGLLLAWPNLPLTTGTGQLENVYGFLALIGIVSFAILGMLYKILPFLVWYASYSKEIGRRRVPSLADLYSAELQAWGYGLFLGGLLATSAATAFGNERAVRWSCLLLLASVLLFLWNMARILSHLVYPRLETQTPKPAVTGTSTLSLI